MTDNLHNDVFHEAAHRRLKALNAGLLRLELAATDDVPPLLLSLRDAAQQLKKLAQTAEAATVATIASYIEALLQTLHHDVAGLSPGIADALYDGLDVIERLIDEEATPPDEMLVAEVVERLEAQVSVVNLPETPDNTDDPRRITDSVEMPSLPDNALAPDDAAGDELLNIFYAEASEHLVALNEGILQVEMQQTAPHSDILHEMNRVAHSLKGAARAVGFGLVETLSHALEDVFQQAEADTLELTPQTADVLYDALDIIQNAINGQPDEQSVMARVLLQLEHLTQSNNIAPTSDYTAADTPLSGDDPVPPADKTPEMEIPASLMTSTIETGAAPTLLMRSPEETLRVPVNRLDDLMAGASELLVSRMQAENREARLRTLHRTHARWQREWRSVRAAYIRLVRRTQDAKAADDDLSPEMATLFKFLETNQRYLIETSRELSQLGQLLAQDNMQLATLTERLQEDVSNLRMMPFETVVGGFQRMVRDLAHDLNKQVHLHITGAGVEIDKTVLDALKDPLMHLLRNAVDHGLESTRQRQEAGKSQAGHVWLDVEQRGSNIAITVQDDGHGLNLARIRQMATERGLLTPQEATHLSDDEVRLLVFRGGFSTSDSVTAVSGRGLGLDIVRDRVENLRGRVSIESISGAGTTITLHVPVSLTRIRAILLDVGEEQYALPSTMVERMETVAQDAIFTAEGQEMIVLNERPMPLVSLGDLLGTPQMPPRGETLHLLALHVAEQAVAFEVDYLHSERELVLKPLGDELQGAQFVAGAALLGSGQVVIVLDANDLVRQGSGGQPVRVQPVRSVPETVARTRVLVVDDSITTRTLEKTILENAGFDVVVAVDGMEAWQRLPDIAPDVLVTDVEMPQMDGLELTRRVKNSSRWQELPVILLTSLGKPEQREAGLSAGADAYLIKSRFDQGELLETIRQFQ